MVIGVIGGGASGMAAALAAAENRDAQVILMERQTRVGRKLLSTGNGRCNLTNLHAGAGGYHGSAPEFALNLDSFRGKLTLSVWIFLIAMLMYCGNSAFIYANF